ncbi:MAG: hypothetical protein AMXMBFR84_16770 [Candidatus Hydrogenedentota bacterium]
MSVFEDTNPRALKELLAEIHGRTMVLPDFQRDFVWEPSATQELVVSIANNYPAGSILRVRDVKRSFVAREFEGAPPLDGAKHTFLVLDGQQRLTSLYQAFYGVGDHRYYIRLNLLIEGADFDEAIFNVRSTTKWVKRREAFEMQAKELLLPLSVLKHGSGGFGKWARKVARHLPDKERIALEDALDHIEERWLSTIDDYHFPVVTLSDKTEADALCTIFETLNRTGVRLSPFELLTARFWPQGINLRALWDATLEEFPIIEDYSVDPYYVLQSIALVSRKTPSCKRSDVLDLVAADIDEYWPKAIRGLALGLEILRDDCNVVLPKWLPYQTILIPLAAVLAKLGMPKTAEAGSYREKLKRWFWCVSFGQVYENAPNSQAARDVTELCAWLTGGDPPDSVSKARFDPNFLRETTPKQRSIYRSAICLILGMGARDFHTQSVITGKLITSSGIDDHHVFPAAYLDRQGVKPARLRDCVLNRTLIDRTTNQMIGDKPPSIYLARLRDTDGFPLDAVLSSHCLPRGDESPLVRDDFDHFIAWRQEALWQEIQRLTGIHNRTEQVESEYEIP